MYILLKEVLELSILKIHLQLQEKEELKFLKMDIGDLYVIQNGITLQL
jgi:hypothetical protein